MAAKRFKTRFEEEIEQLLRDKNSKYTKELFNEVFNEILTFVISDLFYMQITGTFHVREHWGSRENKTHFFPWDKSLSASPWEALRVSGIETHCFPWGQSLGA